MPAATAAIVTMSTGNQAIAIASGIIMNTMESGTQKNGIIMVHGVLKIIMIVHGIIMENTIVMVSMVRVVKEVKAVKAVKVIKAVKAVKAVKVEKVEKVASIVKATSMENMDPMMRNLVHRPRARHLTVLHLTVLHLTTRHPTVLHPTAPHQTVLHLAALHLTRDVISTRTRNLVYRLRARHLIVLHLRARHPIVLHLTVLHLTVLHLTARHQTAPHPTAPHLTAPHLAALLLILLLTKKHPELLISRCRLCFQKITSHELGDGCKESITSKLFLVIMAKKLFELTEYEIRVSRIHVLSQFYVYKTMRAYTLIACFCKIHQYIH